MVKTKRRNMKKQERLLKRKQARAFKRLEREQYEWAAMGW